MLYHDEKYLRILSSQLDRFTQKHAHTFNFRCPLCGDSERVASKTRGYIFPKNQILMYKCHNCGVALPFAALLRRMSRFLYDQYILELLQDSRPTEASPEPQGDAPRDVQTPGELPALTDCASSQNALYPVYRFAADRLIPESGMTRLYATDTAHSWILPLVGEDKAKKVDDGPPYLVIPLRLPDGEWYGAQLRSLARKEYITFRWKNEPLKVFGLENWNPLHTTYLVEGPLDALFIDNALAACGSDLMGVLHVLNEQKIFKHDTKRVFVWDNEPRNKEVVRHIQTAIRLHESVVLWPKGYPKDINDAVKDGYSAADVAQTMKDRTFVGLSAELEFAQWRK